MTAQNSKPMQTTLFPMSAPESRPLTTEQLARLQAAGATANEVQACERVTGIEARARLVSCFCEAARNDWHKLKCHVAYLLAHRDAGLALPIGSERLTHTVQARFPGCVGNQTHRLIFARLVAIVRPDLRHLIDFDSDKDSTTNAVLWSGWQAPASVDWMAIEPAESGGAQP